MQSLLIATFGTLAIAITVTSPVLANKTAVNSNITQNRIVANITPFNLVSLAYQGKFKDRGVRGYNSLLTAIKFGEISGKDLVQHGIETGRLSPDVIDNSRYIKAVEYQLQNLSRN
ncbi:MAG: hypothetical protein AAF378_10080 [Cyanobacteria bacterium P01_A01_bin.84]